MKKVVLIILSLVASVTILNAQDHDEMVSNCALGIGDNTTYLKDFIIKLPKGIDRSDLPVHKANIYLMKNQNYRFTMCNDDISDGELVLGIYDRGRLIISTLDEKSGTVSGSFDFSCNKTGLYELRYSFRDGRQGLGVGIVSLVR